MLPYATPLGQIGFCPEDAIYHSPSWSKENDPTRMKDQEASCED